MYMYVEMLMTFVVLTVPFGLMLLRKNRGVYEYMACGNELKSSVTTPSLTKYAI